MELNLLHFHNKIKINYNRILFYSFNIVLWQMCVSTDAKEVLMHMQRGLSKLVTSGFSQLTAEQLGIDMGLPTTCPDLGLCKLSSSQQLGRFNVLWSRYLWYFPKTVYQAPCCGFWDSVVFVTSSIFSFSACYPVVLEKAIT